MRTCEEIQVELLGHHAGEGSVLERQRIDAHLSGCPACQQTLDAIVAMTEAARQGPTPLTPEARSRILAKVTTETRQPIARERGGSGRLARWMGRWVLPPSLGAAAAAAVFFVLQPAPTPAPPVPAPIPTPAPVLPVEAPRLLEGWIAAGPGVEAWAPVPTEVTVDVTDEGSRLTLDHGALLVRFTGAVARGPMIIRTDDGSVTVKGTVFFVDRQTGHLEAGVARGRIEVAGTEGSVEVDVGQAARVTGPSAGLVEATSPWFAALAARFPPETEPVLDDAVGEAAEGLEGSLQAVKVNFPKARLRRPAPPERTSAPPPDPKVLGRIVREKLPLIQNCYEKRLKHAPGREGTFTLELTYGRDGVVQEARLLEGATGVEDGLGTCVVKEARTFAFPPSPTGEVTLKIPFTLTPAGGLVPTK